MSTEIEARDLTPAAAEHLRTRMAAPVFILAAPRSFSSLVAGMIGVHPQLYGLPELQLFGSETMAEWWHTCTRASFPMAHGLLRAVSQLLWQEQTPASVAEASAWIWRRSHWTTGMMFEVLGTIVYPRMPLEKSPSVVYRMHFLERQRRLFPNARFIHLVRHPRGHAESVLKAVREAEEVGPVPYWLRKLVSFPSGTAEQAEMDPQHAWLHLNRNIDQFLETVPPQQWMRIRAENLLTDPSTELRTVAEWLGVRTDVEALNQMMHPEASPYACLGPPGARLGNDVYFLESPALRPQSTKVHSLSGPLEWGNDGRSFSSAVMELAGMYGYS